jgi:pimeloyl-ACP methyl ester carboxylesterase
MVNREHHLVYVPGLNDRLLVNRVATSFLPFFWRPYGFHGHVVHPYWRQGTDFEPKLESILTIVDELAMKGHQVSLVGQSAGGSAVLNAFMRQPGQITGVVNIAGRLRSPGQPSLAKASKGNPAFAASVFTCEKQLPSLTEEERRRIMTIRPLQDTVVPADSVAIEGATNVVSTLQGHSVGGAQIASIRSETWLTFLRELAK